MREFLRLLIPTNRQTKKAAEFWRSMIALTFIVIVGGNIINALLRDKIEAPESSYEERDGFPLFSDQKKYISILKRYPYNCGTKLRFFKITKDRSYWDIAHQNGVTIDTIIAANPFLTSLAAREGIEIVVPSENGVLVACNDIFDPYRMSKVIPYNNSYRGDYLPSLFQLFSPDDIRFVFFKNARPQIVNSRIEPLYSIKRNFNPPTNGVYSSLYGERSDPFINMPAFHAGLDIRGRTGEPVHPVKDGYVVFSGWKEGGLGKAIIIMHKDGYISTYGHCSALLVDAGDHVKVTDMIARVGSTGRTTGSHLHFEMMRHGERLNPLYFLW